MLHHLSLGVNDLAAAARFYDAVLGTLGYVRVWSDLDPGGNGRAVGYGPPGQPGDRLALKERPAAARTTARRDCGRPTGRITTLRSYAIPTDTGSKPSSTRRPEHESRACRGPCHADPLSTRLPAHRAPGATRWIT